mmetsp:Transcript_100218/g.282756  ORF Transcript_100218/g.282756 Transcript_100218/m.282756 type:complete len:219 (-) Transcript_100218:153-809(-)
MARAPVEDFRPQPLELLPPPWFMEDGVAGDEERLEVQRRTEASAEASLDASVGKACLRWLCLLVALLENHLFRPWVAAQVFGCLTPRISGARFGTGVQKVHGDVLATHAARHVQGCPAGIVGSVDRQTAAHEVLDDQEAARSASDVQQRRRIAVTGLWAYAEHEEPPQRRQVGRACEFERRAVQAATHIVQSVVKDRPSRVETHRVHLKLVGAACPPA